MFDNTYYEPIMRKVARFRALAGTASNGSFELTRDRIARDSSMLYCPGRRI